MSEIQDLVRANIRRLNPYSCARDEYRGTTGIFLDANENSFGSVLKSGLNRYPDPRQRELKARIASVKGTAIERTFLGNGSDEVIDLLIRIFCEPKQDKIMLLPPTYGMYRVAADINNVPVAEVPLTAGFQLDLNRIFAQTDGVKLLFICSPNNPSGNLIRANDISNVLDNFKGLVVLDEAYMDFAPGQSWLPRLNQHRKLVIMQTFSKAWGLAGVRLGMAFADPEIIELLTKIKYPYNVSGSTQQLALEALSHIEKKDKFVEQILAERRKLIDNLNTLMIVETVYPSDANFLLVKFRQTRKVFDYLIKRRIIVRDRSTVIRCDNCLRITVGTPEENRTLIKTLEQFVAEHTETAGK